MIPTMKEKLLKKQVDAAIAIVDDVMNGFNDVKVELEKLMSSKTKSLSIADVDDLLIEMSKFKEIESQSSQKLNDLAKICTPKLNNRLINKINNKKKAQEDIINILLDLRTKFKNIRRNSNERRVAEEIV